MLKNISCQIFLMNNSKTIMKLTMKRAIQEYWIYWKDKRQKEKEHKTTRPSRPVVPSFFKTTGFYSLRSQIPLSF